MLSFHFTDTDGREIVYDRILALQVNEDETAPADSLTAVFPLDGFSELCEITVEDGGTTVFIGAVDEQQRMLSKNGALLKISARSLAARLLDNESVPVTYHHPTAGLIFEKHVAPYGIGVTGDMRSVYFGELVVTKGMSEWTVVKNFCNNCFSASPRIGADGVLRLLGESGGDSSVFSDSGNGIRYTGFSETLKRHEEISRVNVKINSTDGYSYCVNNPEALARSIRRERYLNATLAETPMRCAEEMIKNGRKNSFVMKLECPGRLLGLLGRNAVFKNGEETLSGLYVSSVSYRLTSSLDVTTVTLKRRDT